MADEGNNNNILCQRLHLVLEQRQLRDAMRVLNDETHDGDLAPCYDDTLPILRVFRRHLNRSVLALHDAGDDDQLIFQGLRRLAFQALPETIDFWEERLELRLLEEGSILIEDVAARNTAAELAAHLSATDDIGDDETISQQQKQPYRDGGFGSVPACAAAVRSLEKQTFCADGGGGGGVTECSICFEEFADGAQVSVMPCPFQVHKFHPDCISKWLAISNMCPLCRYELPACYDKCPHSKAGR